MKTKSYSSIKAEFTNTFSNTITDLNESQSGTIYLKENAYKLELESQIIISDGETNWIYLIDEEEIKSTMKLLYQKEGLKLEGAGAITSAAMLNQYERFQGEDSLIIVTGGNIEDSFFDE